MTQQNQTSPTTPPKSTDAPRRPIGEAIDELDRELAVRERCYDRWVTEKRLSLTDARDRLDRLVAALAFLRRYAEVLDNLDSCHAAAEEQEACQKGKTS